MQIPIIEATTAIIIVIFELEVEVLGLLFNVGDTIVDDDNGVEFEIVVVEVVEDNVEENVEENVVEEEVVDGTIVVVIGTVYDSVLIRGLAPLEPPNT